jgi:hypothetical protein
MKRKENLEQFVGRQYTAGEIMNRSNPNLLLYSSKHLSQCEVLGSYIFSAKVEAFARTFWASPGLTVMKGIFWIVISKVCILQLCALSTN